MSHCKNDVVNAVLYAVVLQCQSAHTGTVGLPPELQRLLKTIQDLDERAQGTA